MAAFCASDNCRDWQCEYNKNIWPPKGPHVLVEMEGDIRYCPKSSLHNFGRPFNGVARVKKG